MSDEVKAAAERILEAIENENFLAETKTGHTLLTREVRDVCQSYLALHDDAPVTAAWLRSVGFVLQDGYSRNEINIYGAPFDNIHCQREKLLVDLGKRVISIGFVDIRLTTRGQILSLLRVIDTKEGA